MEVTYVHLPSGSEPPALEAAAPYKAIVLVEDDVTDEWQDRISDWFVESGCLYMMAWGRNCSSWDDAVDYSILARYDDEAVPEAKEVWTTWHASDTLHELFWFSHHEARHGIVDLQATLIFDIVPQARKREILSQYAYAIIERWPSSP